MERSADQRSTQAPGRVRRGSDRRAPARRVDDATQPLAQVEPVLDPVLELRERELVRDYVIEEIEQRHLDASPSESAIVADWVGKMDRDSLREENRRLRALLDGVQESAALLGPDGRILYCNRMALRRLRARIGVPRGEIIGRTPAELGVTGELVIGRSIDELVPLARAHESVETTAWGRTYEARFDAVYKPDGTVSAIGMVVKDVHSRKLAETRMDLLTKLARWPRCWSTTSSRRPWSRCRFPSSRTGAPSRTSTTSGSGARSWPIAIRRRRRCGT